MLLACSTVPYESAPLGRALEGMASAGFRHVVVGPAHDGKPVLDVTAGVEGASELKAELEKAGLSAAALWPELCPLDDDTIDALLVVLAQAKALGSQQVWIDAPAAFDDDGKLLSDDEWEASVEGFAARLGPVAARARELGVRLGIPTSARLNGCAAESEKLFGLVKDEDVRLAYNPGLVSYFTGANPKRDLEHVANRVGALCVRDHSGAVGEANFPRAGGGEVDYMAVFGILKGKGFAGPVVVEHLPGESLEELDASARQAQRFMSMLIRRS